MTTVYEPQSKEAVEAADHLRAAGMFFFDHSFHGVPGFEGQECNKLWLRLQRLARRIEGRCLSHGKHPILQKAIVVCQLEANHEGRDHLYIGDHPGIPEHEQTATWTESSAVPDPAMECAI